MTKDVLITIRGVHTLDHEDNDVEMIIRGDYYQKNGKHYILYEEILEGDVNTYTMFLNTSFSIKKNLFSLIKLNTNIWKRNTSYE